MANTWFIWVPVVTQATGINTDPSRNGTMAINSSLGPDVTVAPDGGPDSGQLLTGAEDSNTDPSCSRSMDPDTALDRNSSPEDTMCLDPKVDNIFFLILLILIFYVFTVVGIYAL